VTRGNAFIVEWVDKPPPPGNGDGSKAHNLPPRESMPLWIMQLLLKRGSWARLDGNKCKSAMDLSHYRKEFPGLEITWRQGAAYARVPEDITIEHLSRREPIA